MQDSQRLSPINVVYFNTGMYEYRNYIYVPGGVYYALYMALSISKLFSRKGLWMRMGGTWYVKLLYILARRPPPPPPQA